MQSIFNASRALKARGLAALPGVVMMAALAWPSAALAWTGQPLAYVTSFANNTVSVIDTGDNTVVDTVPVGMGPAALAVTWDGTHVYVANTGDNTISVIETVNKTDTVAATIPVGAQPLGLAVTPDGTHVYVSTGPGYGTALLVIDTETNAVSAIPLPCPPASSNCSVELGQPTVTPDGTTVYIPGEVVYAQPLLYKIDTASNSAQVSSIAVNSFGGSLFFSEVLLSPDATTGYGLGSSSFLDVSAGVLAALSLPADLLLWQSASCCADSPIAGGVLSPDGTRIYVASPATTTAQNSVSVIDSATGAVTATIPVDVDVEALSALAITPDGKYVYLTTQPVEPPASGSVLAIDTATNTLVLQNPVGVGGAIPVGNDPKGIAIIPPPQGVPFLAVKAKLDINLGQNFFALRSEFTLSSTASPVDPATQPVKLQVGPFITTIPAGSFTQTERGSYAYQGAIDGVQLDVKIAPTGTLRYKLHATAKGANMTGATNPAQVSYSIGGNAGLTNVNANFDQSNQAAQN